MITAVGVSVHAIPDDLGVSFDDVPRDGNPVGGEKRVPEIRRPDVAVQVCHDVLRRRRHS